jgi:hypothetical protein
MNTYMHATIDSHIHYISYRQSNTNIYCINVFGCDDIGQELLYQYIILCLRTPFPYPNRPKPTNGQVLFITLCVDDKQPLLSTICF